MATVTSSLTSHLLSPRPTPMTPASDVSATEISMDSNDISNQSLPNHHHHHHQFSVEKLVSSDRHRRNRDDEEDASCCSEDTVLSVGNEAPLNPNEAPISQLSFKNIQNHLNAISAITNSITAGHQNLTPTPSISPNFISTSPSVERLSPNSSNRSCPSSPSSPSSYLSSNAYTIRHSQSPKVTNENLQFNNNNNKNNEELIQNQNNNNNNNHSLKFSIDNILKADFGRRITDPLHIKKGHRLNSHKKLTHAVNSLTLSKSFAAISEDSSSNCKRPVDLSKSDSTSLLSASSAGGVGGATTLKVPASSSPNPDAKSSSLSSSPASSTATASGTSSQPMLWPAWVYCTRYSDRPSSGRSKYTKRKTNTHNTHLTSPSENCPRSRRTKKPSGSPQSPGSSTSAEEKRPRTAFSGAQLARLKHEFAENRYLTERRRQQLSAELGLNEAQIKIWFQNKRAKIKKASGHKNPLALQLMAQGLYNHSTVPLTREEEELQQQSNGQG